LDDRYSANSGTDISVSDTRQGISFNDIDFGLFKIESDCYLFNKRTYKSFRISETSFSYLLSLKTGDAHLAAAPEIESTFVKQLADKGIIRVNG
jgi:hypothetical protein